jgi:hypothetical protein
MVEHRVKMEEEDLRRLVRGEVVTLKTEKGDTVLVILADIGFDRITAALYDAMSR